jgi:CTP:phosphocholine cytidylyltransferase-like protein/thiamine kinase-like enzyme
MKEHPDFTQRELAHELELSLGTVNTLMKECVQKGLVTAAGDTAGRRNSAGASSAASCVLTNAGEAYLEQYRVDGALIIAAGFGSRFVPLTFETPKGLLEVFGERMIERQIRQLHEAGVTDITIVVGYLKEKFEYLIDKYDVKLLYNPEYSHKNTLATIYRAREVLRGRNMYILSSDNWMRENMYHTWECGAWYASSYMEGETSEWCLSYNKKGRITGVNVGGKDSWVMYGPVFFSKAFSDSFLPLLERAYQTPGTEQFYWENVLMEHIGELEMNINRQPADQIYEFENLEELRLFDPKYQNRSDNQAMELVAEVFGVAESEIHDIKCLKAGMTNQSFLFKVHGQSYICRIPGKGTELLINRPQEAAVYEVIRPLGLAEHVVYMNPETGYKIAEYYEGARNADASDHGDMVRCMAALHRLHDAKLVVDHEFNLRERIDFYEKLCLAHGGTQFEDYELVRGRMDELMARLDQLARPKYLSHIDSVADNFLFTADGDVRLIDWEYAGMCDPLVDVAMCAIYSYYNEEETDALIGIYLGREASVEERFVVYAYMALGGFLWSLWAIYKSALGVEFGDYTLVMYRYAKKYYRRAMAIVDNLA